MTTPAARAKAVVEETRVLKIGDLVRALEGAAMNTDTDPRWLAASELRRLEQWQDRKINIRSGEQP